MCLFFPIFFVQKIRLIFCPVFRETKGRAYHVVTEEAVRNNNRPVNLTHIEKKVNSLGGNFFLHVTVLLA